MRETPVIRIAPALGGVVQPSRTGSIIILLAFGWICLVVICGLFAAILAPHDPNQTNLLLRLRPPLGFGGTSEFILGTDNVGRDVLSRLIYATRLSLLIALVGTCSGCILGTALGFLAAHCRGWVDDVIMALVDFQAAVPFIIIAIAVIAFLGTDFSVLLIMICLFGWDRFARLARSLALAAENETYVIAATAYGTKPFRLYQRHILINNLAVLLINLTLTFPETVLLESSLSFLGLGIQPPNASLGTMLSQGRDYLINAWWIAIFAGLLIFLTTLSVSLIGDWLRDRIQTSDRQ